MILDIEITDKTFALENLMQKVRFSVTDGEKVGVIGRNGAGKTTLFNIIAGLDTDYTGSVIFRRGATVVTTAQEHHQFLDKTVLQYILSGLPEYEKLSRIIETYPETMGENWRKINEYSEALERFNAKGFYQIEEKIERELANFQLDGLAHRKLAELSGGQKRLLEIVKVMQAQAQLALIDEPTNHMDYVAKQIFIDWLKSAKEAMLIITHDRDVLGVVDRIVELKDKRIFSYKGNYDAYLTQNTVKTTSGMNEYEVVQRKIENLRQQVRYARSKKASWTGTADKRNPFVVMENRLTREINELLKIEKPSFWIDQNSVETLDHKQTERYAKYKARNIRVAASDATRSGKSVLLGVKNLSLGYDKPLFSDVNFELHDGERLEIRGRNGAGKTTLVQAVLGTGAAQKFAGEIFVKPELKIGVYNQEIASDYFQLSLCAAVEKMYLDRKLSISEQKVRQLLSDYLFTPTDIHTPVAQLSGGQKARFQLIAMLADDPQLLILDEPTNHLDLPSIEELENALKKYHGAIIYISHDNYFRQSLPAEILQISA